MQGVGGAFKRYGSYGLAMLKSPSRAINQAETLRMKYAWISIVLCGVFFALGNYVQLKASKTRLLGFGIHYSFGDAFLRIAVFTLILLTLMMLTVWLLGKYMLKGNISLKEVIMKFGAALVLRFGFIHPLACICHDEYSICDGHFICDDVFWSPVDCDRTLSLDSIGA
nr:hypothetical protein [Bacillus pumilus]